MRTIFYDDQPIRGHNPRSIFLAGPTARNVIRTPWRQQAIDLLSELRPEGTIIVPEFRDKKFDRDYFQSLPLGCFSNRAIGQNKIPNMHHSTQNIIDWETAGLDNCDVLLIWMPFSDELPGRTTRSEASRAIERMRLTQWPTQKPKLVLGMPDNTDSGGRIRYDAYHYDINIHATLEDCCLEAARLTHYYGDK